MFVEGDPPPYELLCRTMAIRDNTLLPPYCYDILYMLNLIIKDMFLNPISIACQQSSLWVARFEVLKG